MTRLYGAKGWVLIALMGLVLFVVFPILSLKVPNDSSFHLSQYWVTLVGKIMCYAIVALAMDLIWGYAGILSLGHGLFFALGGYAMGMYLMRQIGRQGQYQSDLPDFMVFLDWKELPWHWWNTDQFWWAALLVVAVPGLLAYVFGYFAFRSRVKGVYFSIITQALTFAAMLAFFRNAMGFGGNPEKGKEYFERALELTDRKFLLIQYNYARSYAVQTNDRALFERLLREVIDAGDISNDNRLPNKIAARRARRLLAQADEIFF